MVRTYPVHVEDGSPFSIDNIPFGIFSTKADPRRRIATIIGEHVLDLNFLASKGIFTLKNCNGTSSPCPESALLEPCLNAFAAQGPRYCTSIRNQVIEMLSSPSSVIFTNDEINQKSFTSTTEAIMHLPMDIGGFSDFLCSDVHASNCARLAGQTMHPSFYAFPTAYNGRASSVLVSGTPVSRLQGMVRDPAGAGTGYMFAPTTRLDFELEMGVFISRPIPYGQGVTAQNAAREHIFGYVLLNDWSARDVQFAEMIPLGPFNGKATATTISPWIVTPDALKSARCESSVAKAKEEWRLLPRHLQHGMEGEEGDGSTFDVDLEVAVVHGKAQAPETICRSNLRHLYWSPGQIVAHQASSGCGLCAGDLIGTGTISGPGHTDASPTLGCLFELTESGKKAVALPSGRQMVWVEDGDEIVMSGWARSQSGKRIGFGEARALILPADRKGL